MGSADADVVQSAVVAEGEGAAGVDHVAAHPCLGLSLRGCGRGGFGSGLVGGGWGAPVQGAVRPPVVVVADEAVAEGLQLGDGGGLVLGGFGPMAAAALTIWRSGGSFLE